MTQGSSLHSKTVLADATQKSMKLISYRLNFLDYSSEEREIQNKEKKKRILEDCRECH